MNMTHNLVHKRILSFRGYIFIKMSNFKCLYILFCFKESPRFRVPGNMYNPENDITI